MLKEITMEWHMIENDPDDLPEVGGLYYVVLYHLHDKYYMLDHDHAEYDDEKKEWKLYNDQIAEWTSISEHWNWMKVVAWSPCKSLEEEVLSRV